MERKRSAGKNLMIVFLFLSLSTFSAMSGYANETESFEPRETLKEVIVGLFFSKMEQDADKYQRGINSIGDNAEAVLGDAEIAGNIFPGAFGYGNNPWQPA